MLLLFAELGGTYVEACRQLAPLLDGRSVNNPWAARASRLPLLLWRRRRVIWLPHPLRVVWCRCCREASRLA